MRRRTLILAAAALAGCGGGADDDAPATRAQSTPTATVESTPTADADRRARARAGPAEGVPGAGGLASARRGSGPRRQGLVHGAAHRQARAARPAHRRRRGDRAGRGVRAARRHRRPGRRGVGDGRRPQRDRPRRRPHPSRARLSRCPPTGRTRTSTRRRSAAAPCGSPGSPASTGASTPARAGCACSTPRAAPAPTASTATPAGAVYFASLAGSYLGHVNLRSGRATVLEPPTSAQGARRVWSDSAGRLHLPRGLPPFRPARGWTARYRAVSSPGTKGGLTPLGGESWALAA